MMPLLELWQCRSRREKIAIIHMDVPLKNGRELHMWYKVDLSEAKPFIEAIFKLFIDGTRHEDQKR